MRYYYMILVGSNFSDLTRLHSFVQENDGIHNWWHYLDTAYILESSTTLTKMESILHKMFPKDNFMLMDINPQYYGGYLPKEAWDWLKQFENIRFTFQEGRR